MWYVRGMDFLGILYNLSALVYYVKIFVTNDLKKITTNPTQDVLSFVV